MCLLADGKRYTRVMLTYRMTHRNSRRRSGALTQFYRWALGIGYERNVGGTERAVRYLLGAALLFAGAVVAFLPVVAGALNWVVVVVALVSGLYLVYEAQVQYCPLNDTVGRSTYRGD